MKRIVRLIVYKGSEADLERIAARNQPDGYRQFETTSMRIYTLRNGWFSRLRHIVRALFMELR